METSRILKEITNINSKNEANEDLFYVKQYNTANDYRPEITEYYCKTMSEVRKIFRESSELNQIDKVEVFKGDKLLYVGNPISPSENNKRWSISWKKYKSESAKKNEDSNTNSFLEDVEGIIEHAKEAVLKRLRYRFYENVSYFGSELTEKEEEVKFQVEESMKNLIDEIYNIVG